MSATCSVPCRRGLHALGAALLILALLCRPAPAQEIEIELHRTVAPAWPALPNPDVLGIHLGASPEEVMRIITALNPSFRIKEVTKRLTITAGGRQVSSTPYLSAIEADNYRQTARGAAGFTWAVKVAFALPTSGGGVVGVSTFRNSVSGTEDEVSAALIHRSAFLVQLVQAYGPPSKDTSVAPDASGDPDVRGIVSMQWRFSAASRVPCAYPCAIDPGPIVAERLGDYKQGVSQGETFRVHADGYPRGADRAQLRSFSISMEDVAHKALSLDEAIKQMTVSAREATPGGGAPK